MDIEIRPMRDGDIEGVARSDNRAFSSTLGTDKVAERFRLGFDVERFVVAEDAGRIVANAGAFPMQMTTPGGEVPVSGVTWVAVTGTHRRRGVMRGMLDRLATDALDRGEVANILFASEGSIYENVGYGAATTQRVASVSVREVRFRDEPNGDVQVRFAEPSEYSSAFAVVWDRARQRRVGEVDVPAGLAAARLADRSGGEGRPEAFVLVAEQRGKPVGYAVYRTKERWNDGHPAHEVHLEDLAAFDDDVAAELWRVLCSLDLVATIFTRVLALDDPLPWRLVNPRVIRTTSLNDGLWVRLVDVAAFFDRRGFATDDELVVDAGDLGVWALGASGCSRADREPDVSLSAGDLGAVSLGGHRLRAMWRAGRVREHRAGAVDRFDAMLAVDPLPYCVVQF